MRVSDADREQAAGDLRDHYAAGRISSDELSDRLDQVYAAQTGAELDGLRGGRPATVPDGRSTTNGGPSGTPAAGAEADGLSERGPRGGPARR